MRKEHANKLRVGDWVVFRTNKKLYRIQRIDEGYTAIDVANPKVKYPLFYLGSDVGWVTYILLVKPSVTKGA